MSIKVNFYATLRALAGQKTCIIESEPQPTARKLLEAIVTQYPALRRELVNERLELFGHMKFFINGREVIYLPEEMETIIQPEDKVDIFPPVGGG
jgi:MoaD family protein